MPKKGLCKPSSWRERVKSTAREIHGRSMFVISGGYIFSPDKFHELRPDEEKPSESQVVLGSQSLTQEENLLPTGIAFAFSGKGRKTIIEIIKKLHLKKAS